MRWWNSALGALKSVAFCREGGVRAAWKLILACALYAMWAWAAARFLSMGFGALFDAWGLNAQTLSQAPGWAQALAAHYGKLISLISSAGVLALSWALMRVLASGRFERLRAADFARGALVGAAWVALGAGLFLLADSMRPYERGLTLHADMLWMLAVYLLAALAEERFTRTLTMRVAALNARPCWAYIASCIVFLVVTGGYALGPLGAVNMLLFALVCARLSATGRAGASVGLRFAWSWAGVSLFAFPGADTGAQPCMQLYAVSEHWLTGGSDGIVCGVWTTLLLLLLAAWLFAPMLRRRRQAPSPASANTDAKTPRKRP